MNKLISSMQKALDKINNVIDADNEHISDEAYFKLEETRGFLAETIELLSNP